jgi:hypothetical protein
MAAPDAPTTVLATDGAFTNKVVVTWTKSAGADAYEIFRDGVGLGALGDVATGNDTLMTPGVKYTYKVKAATGAEWSGFSNEDTGYARRMPLPEQTVAVNNRQDEMPLVDQTIQAVLKDYTAVAANAQSESDVLDLTGKSKAALFITHARDIANAAVGAGTEYRVLVSSLASGDNGWFPIASYVCDLTAASSIVTDGEEAAGQTAIECGATIPAVNDFVFFKNATIANSEMVKVIAIDATGGSEHFDIAHALTNTQAQATIFNKGEKIVLNLDVSAYKRLKVACNNNNGSTNRAVVWKCEAITS